MELILKPKKLKYTAQDLIDSGISYDVAIEFMAHRKAMKCTCSKRSLSAICREAKLANMTLEAVMIKMMECDWKGFKAGWMKGTVFAPPTAELSFIDKHTNRNWAKTTGITQ